MRRFATKGRSKYGNVKVEMDGVTYDSKREAQRAQFLELMVKAGIIKDLQRQVKYELIPKITHEETVRLKTKTKTVVKTDQLPITYTADFEYVVCETGELQTEDVKISPSLLPKEFELKAKLFFWKTGRKIKLIYKPTQSI